MVNNMTTLINYELRELLLLIEKMKVKVHGEVYNKLNEGLDVPQYYQEFIDNHLSTNEWNNTVQTMLN